ncbi:TRAF-like, partial [Sesbania bispinosa]
MENQRENGHTLQKFRWTIKEFTKLKTNTLYSDYFLLAGYIWRILLRTKEKGVDNLSLYLDVPDSSAFPLGWSRDASFSLSLIDQIHGRNTIKKESKHQYSVKEACQGFMSFLPLNELFDPKNGFLLKDTCIIEAEVFVPDKIGMEKAVSFTSVKVMALAIIA